MTKCTSRSPEDQTYSSLLWHESKVMPGVKFATRRVSLQQRLELTSRVRELILKHEFLKAGDSADQLEVTLGELLVKKAYLEWGLVDLQGISFDGESATPETLIACGPEALAEEIVTAIRGQLHLTEEERKNF